MYQQRQHGWGKTLHPGIASHYVDGFARFHFALCDEWGLDPTDPIESIAVTSDVPALVLAGGYDPVTPPASGGNRRHPLWRTPSTTRSPIQVTV